MWWYHFLNYVNICEICYRIGSAMTVETTWVGDKTENSMPVFFCRWSWFYSNITSKIRTGNSVCERSFIIPPKAQSK